jgi:hypothetical protein
VCVHGLSAARKHHHQEQHNAAQAMQRTVCRQRTSNAQAIQHNAQPSLTCAWEVGWQVDSRLLAHVGQEAASLLVAHLLLLLLLLAVQKRSWNEQRGSLQDERASWVCALQHARCSLRCSLRGALCLAPCCASEWHSASSRCIQPLQVQQGARHEAAAPVCCPTPPPATPTPPWTN